MSKEYLGALENLKQQAIAFEHSELAIKVANMNYTTLRQALQRLESIDDVEPDEALKWLNQIVEYITEDKKVKYKATILFDCDIIKDALLKAQTNEEILQKYYQEGITLDSVRALKKERDFFKKSLEIIKEKKVSIFQLSCCKNVNEYNDLKFKDSEKLTKEEFNLLKMML